MNKKNIFTISVILIIFIAVVFSFTVYSKLRGPEKVYIKTLESNRFQLMINNQPHIVRGIVYSPVPIGNNHAYDFWGDPLRPYARDGRLMKAIGANAIRVYQPGKDIKNTKQVIRDFYNKFGIRVAMGHWLGFWDSPNYADRDFKERVKKDVADMVSTYKDERGILFWILGNENNVSFSYGPQSMNLWTTPEIEALDDPYAKRQMRAKIYYAFVDDIAEEIRRIDPNHPVVLANAELTDINMAAEVTPNIDILGCSIYRGKSFGSFFREAAVKFNKPVLITEFGCDSYDAFLNKEDEAVQEEFIEAQWNEISKNTFKGNGEGNSIGGFVFEWTDEWWKFNEENKTGWYAHDTVSSWSNGAYYFDIKAPQNLNINEEWWGICSLDKKEGGLDERRPRRAYFKLKEMWK